MEVGMKVLFTHPYFWPAVRLGAEREIHDAAVRLRAAGEDVRLLTSHERSRDRKAKVDGIPVTYTRSWVTDKQREQGWDDTNAFYGAVHKHVADSDAKLIHSFHYADAAAAVISRKPGVPVILKMTGTIVPERIRERRPLDARLVQTALER